MERKDVLSKLAAKEITEDEAERLLEEDEARRMQKAVYCKVSTKGAISLYGLQRMPVTLYNEQWDRIYDEVTEKMIRQCQVDNKDILKKKGDPIDKK